MEEKWKSIPGYPNYTISNFGEVFSIRKNRILKQHINSDGFLTVYLERDGEWKQVVVHRIVALEFVDGYFDGAVVKFKDGDKSNICWYNLEWGTQVGQGRPKIIWKRINRKTGEFEDIIDD